MGNSPAFQFYPADFLSYENVMLMSNQEVGCYVKLMCILLQLFYFGLIGLHILD